MILTEDDKFSAIDELQFITASLRHVEELIQYQIEMGSIYRAIDELGYQIEALKASHNDS